jgi:hypothetical protein
MSWIILLTLSPPDAQPAANRVYFHRINKWHPVAKPEDAIENREDAHENSDESSADHAESSEEAPESSPLSPTSSMEPQLLITHHPIPNLSSRM